MLLMVAEPLSQPLSVPGIFQKPLMNYFLLKLAKVKLYLQLRTLSDTYSEFSLLLLITKTGLPCFVHLIVVDCERFSMSIHTGHYF